MIARCNKGVCWKDKKGNAALFTELFEGDDIVSSYNRQQWT